MMEVNGSPYDGEEAKSGIIADDDAGPAPPNSVRPLPGMVNSSLAQTKTGNSERTSESARKLHELLSRHHNKEHSLLRRWAELALPTGVVHAWLRAQTLGKGSQLAMMTTPHSQTEAEFAKLWRVLDANCSGYLDSDEWDDMLYVVFAYSAVRCAHIREEVLKVVLQALYDQWHGQDGFTNGRDPVSRERFAQFYHSIRTGRLWYSASKELPSHGTGWLPLEVHRATSHQLFTFVDRALGLRRVSTVTVVSQVVTGLLCGLLPALFYPLLVHRQDAAELRSFAEWAGRAAGGELRALRCRTAGLTLAITLGWAACVYPLLAYAGMLDVQVGVSGYEAIAPYAGFMSWWVAVRASTVTGPEWIRVRRKKRQLDRLTCRVVRLDSNARDMIPVWTVLRGTFSTTHALGSASMLLVPTSPLSVLWKSHALYLTFGLVHSLAPVLHRAARGTLGQLSGHDWLLAMFFTIGSVLFSIPGFLMLSQLSQEFWNYLLSMRRLLAITTRKGARKHGFPVCFDMAHVYSVIAWYRIRRFAMTRLSAPINALASVVACVLLISLAIAGLIVLQVVINKVPVYDLDVFMELLLSFAFAAFLLQVIMVGGLSNVEKVKHFREIQKLRFRLVPRSSERKQRLPFAPDPHLGADELMADDDVQHSRMEEVDIVEVLRAIEDILHQQDQPLKVLGVPLSQRLLTSLATVFGSVLVSVASSLMP